MDSNRKHWNEQQKILRQALKKPADPQGAIDLFLMQHAMVHRAELSQMDLHSFADEVWEGATDTIIRCISPRGEHSITWLIWHLARIEDMTMNWLLAGKPQIFHEFGWKKKLKIRFKHSGNTVMEIDDVNELSQTIDIEALKTYRLNVGASTQRIAQELQPDDFKQKVDPARLEELVKNGSVAKEAADLLAYWGNLTKTDLLLMPPTRHNFVHINEALKVKKKCKI